MTIPDNTGPILRAGVAGLAALYEAGTVTPLQVTDLYYRRISRHNAALGAYNELRKAEARREAEASTARWAVGRPLSPIDGAPIGVKANIMVKDSAWHAGIGAYADRVADRDAACIALLKANGAIVLGMLNMHEAALGGTTDNPWFGRTHNPYRHGFIPGGSSGGSGAAVTAGLCAAALGTDTIGSVRLPAGFCGCVGYKPSRDVIALDGVVPLSPSLDHVGVLARSVADCALVTSGASDRTLGTSTSPRRIVIQSDFGRMAIDENLNRLMAELMDRIVTAGGEIVRFTVDDFDVQQMRKRAQIVVGIEAKRTFSVIETDSEGFSESFIDTMTALGATPKNEIASAYTTLGSICFRIREQLSDVSAMMLPISYHAAFPFSAAALPGLGDFAAPGNIAGVASIVIPLGLSSEGLPLSVQFLGLNDQTVLDIAGWAATLTPALPPPAGFGF